MAYEIGYRRPPTAGRFKKGSSGNPKGRPKGSRNFLTLLEKELGQKVVVNENGKKKTVTRMEAIVKRLVSSALQGEQKAQITLIEIMRRTGGLDKGERDGLLPDNYESVLESYVERRHKSSGLKSGQSSSTKESP